MQEPTAPSRQQATGRRRVGVDGQATSKPAGRAQGALPAGAPGKTSWTRAKARWTGAQLTTRQADTTRQTPPGAGCRPLAVGHTLGKRQNCSTRGSQVIPQPSTSLAQPCLTSEC